MKVDINLRILT